MTQPNEADPYIDTIPQSGSLAESIAIAVVSNDAVGSVTASDLRLLINQIFNACRSHDIDPYETEG